MSKLTKLTFFAFLLAATSLAAGPVFVIDAGHGGAKPSGSDAERTLSSDNNAQTPGGILEKNLTLELSKEIRDALLKEAKKRGVACEVVMTREDDSNPDFGARTKTCLSKGIP